MYYATNASDCGLLYKAKICQNGIINGKQSTSSIPVNLAVTRISTNESSLQAMLASHFYIRYAILTVASIATLGMIRIIESIESVFDADFF